MPARCLHAIQSTGLYEAGGNLLWVDPQLTWDNGYTIPREEPSWALVTQYAEAFFTAAAVAGSTLSPTPGGVSPGTPGGVSPGATGGVSTGQERGRARLLFPPDIGHLCGEGR